MTPALFILAAGLGAATRHRINQFGIRWYSTLIANVIGSFLLGLLAASGPSPSTSTVLGLGFCGSLTTYSMFALEATEGSPRSRVTVISGTLVLGLGAAWVGFALGG